MRKWMQATYLILLFSFVLPSGSLFNVPIKVALSLILLAEIILSGELRCMDQITGSFLYIFVCLYFWSVLSILNGYNTALSFLKNYFSLLFIVWASYELLSKGIVKETNFNKSIIWVSFLLIGLKIFSCLLLSVGSFNMESLSALFKTVFNADLTTMQIQLGSLTIYRIMLSNDAIPYLLYAFYLLKGKKFKISFSLLMGIYTFVIYSRVYILYFASIILLYWLIKIIQNKQYIADHQISVALAIGLTLTAFIIVLAWNNGALFNGIISRFNSHSVSASDSIRDEQFSYLWNGFLENVFVGHGAGSYSKDYIRSLSAPYSYEMEYLSFLYQFGVLGFVLIIAFTVVSFYKTIYSKNLEREVKAMLLLQFLIWLIKPFFNPSFLSSNSGLLIVLMYFYGAYQKEKPVASNEVNEPNSLRQISLI